MPSATVTLTVTDASGNSSTCTSTVTVTDDILPTPSCTDYTYYLDATGFVRAQSYEVGAGSFDNCAIDTMILVHCSLVLRRLSARPSTR